MTLLWGRCGQPKCMAPYPPRPIPRISTPSTTRCAVDTLRKCSNDQRTRCACVCVQCTTHRETAGTCADGNSRAACVYSSQYSGEQDAPEGGRVAIHVNNVMAHLPARRNYQAWCDSGVSKYHSLRVTRGDTY